MCDGASERICRRVVAPHLAELPASERGRARAADRQHQLRRGDALLGRVAACSKHCVDLVDVDRPRPVGVVLVVEEQQTRGVTNSIGLSERIGAPQARSRARAIRTHLVEKPLAVEAPKHSRKLFETQLLFHSAHKLGEQALRHLLVGIVAARIQHELESGLRGHEDKAVHRHALFGDEKDSVRREGHTLQTSSSSTSIEFDPSASYLAKSSTAVSRRSPSAGSHM